MGTLMPRPRKPDLLLPALDHEIADAKAEQERAGRELEDAERRFEKLSGIIEHLTAVRDRLYPQKKADT